MDITKLKTSLDVKSNIDAEKLKNPEITWGAVALIGGGIMFYDVKNPQVNFVFNEG